MRGTTRRRLPSWPRWNRGDPTNAVQLFIEQGGDVGVRNRLGETPLHVAAGTGWLNAAMLLVRSGADVNARTNAGETPLHRAAAGGAADVVDHLLGNNASASARNAEKETPLHALAKAAGVRPAIAKRILGSLLGAGCNTAAKTRRSETALYYAAAAGNLAVVRELLQWGANENPKPSPLEVARQRGHRAIVRVLASTAAEYADLERAPDDDPRVQDLERREGESQKQEHTELGLSRFLANHTKDLRKARGNERKIRAAIARYLKEGSAQGMSPLELRDHFDISAPGMLDGAGFDEQASEHASAIFEQVSREVFRRRR